MSSKNFFKIILAPNHLSQERRHIDRVIDWENDRYQEIIKGAGGEIMRQVDEPLSNHTGKGSSKRKKGKE